MAQPGVNAKIEELQFRIKTDPKSRLFFPLAEELRKNGRLPEAEQVLRTGLGVHATYLSAWVSLGRVLREQHKNTEAVDALTMALQVDPGNVVAARLLADCYLDLGQKLEALKKYKLVHALMPGDEELEAKIDHLDGEINPVVLLPVAPVREEPSAAAPEELPPPFEEALPLAEPEPEPEQEAESSPTEPEAVAAPFAPAQESPFDETTPITRTVERPFDTDDEVPMAAQHSESPFEEPAGYTAAALEVEQPQAIHIEEAPLAAEVPSVWAEEPADGEPAGDVFAPAEAAVQSQDDDLTATTTMADLYVRQGLTDDARKIYEHLLQRDPSNDDVRGKLEALNADAFAPAQASAAADDGEIGQAAAEASEEPRQEGHPAALHQQAKVVVLEKWLGKVSRREHGGA